MSTKTAPSREHRSSGSPDGDGDKMPFILATLVLALLGRNNKRASLWRYTAYCVSSSTRKTPRSKGGPLTRDRAYLPSFFLFHSKMVPRDSSQGIGRKQAQAKVVRGRMESKANCPCSFVNERDFAVRKLPLAPRFPLLRQKPEP